MTSKKKLRRRAQRNDKLLCYFVDSLNEADATVRAAYNYLLELDVARSELAQLQAAAGRLVLELDDCDFTETPEISIRADVVRELLDMDKPDSEKGVTEGDYPNVVDTPAQQFLQAAQSDAGRAVGDAYLAAARGFWESWVRDRRDEAA